MIQTILILQSDYISLKGCFNMINMAYELVLHNDMQCAQRDWKNRNK